MELSCVNGICAAGVSARASKGLPGSMRAVGILACVYWAQMTTNPSMPVNLVNVHGTELLAGDTRELYRQKLARITLDSMVQFVGLLDAKGTVLEINQVALDGGGLQLSDVEGKPFWTTFWWQVSEDINRVLRESILRASQGEFVRWDTEIYGRAGGKETIVIDASLCPVKDQQGNVVFIAAEGRDITEKKAYEREIACQREELAKLDKLKTQFFANVSHEFRTPLTLMLGPLEDALADSEEPLGARQRERMTMVQRNGLRLGKLVSALLDFSRVEAGRIQAVYQSTDLASLTHDLASSFRSACEKAGLTLIIETPQLSKPVFVDHEMWEKIVLNLVSNAFKFTLEGGIRVDMSEEGGQAVLRVSDTGTGIPESEVPRIFDRFHRVEGARGRTHEGTGIGLALVKELIELHKGEVSVESTFGKGTTFIVRMPFGSAHLPRDRVEASRTQPSTATRAEAFVGEALRWLPDGIIAEELEGQDNPFPTPEDANGGRARVLLAEDNADMRHYLSRLLATSYEVTAAADGEEAFAAARRMRPDLILTDVMMPRLDGFGLLQKLRGDPELGYVPVIVLSARAGDEAKIEGLGRGADDYLVKPFSARELRARVGANIELSRTRAQNARVLHEAARILESKVAERTEDLLAANERLRNEAIERERVEEQLRQAQKMEAIGQLTGGVAHDFNNLLTGIGGSLQMIKTRMEQGRMDAVDRYVAAAQDAVKRATALTHRLLAFSRRQTLDPKPTNVNRLVAGMEELIQRTVGPAIHLEVVGAGGLWSTLVDPNQLENALLNLCINARDAMPEGGRLTIETANKWLDDRAAKERELMPGQYVSLCVTDNGTGMTPDVVAHAFDPFFTTKPLGAGTGLGLSMIYGFVRQSGGQVRIYTEEGKGTTMCLYLPRHDSDAGAEDPTGMQSQTAAASGDGEIVLVIDDEPTIRKLIAEVLEDEGYTALEVSDGPSGMRVLQSSERIDLLITDVGLPGGMNGRQIADAARGLRPNLKVLFITGYAENAVVGNGHLEKGMQVVAKPFDMDVLARKIRELIES
jgi:PAS domain S-box-containing protein